LGGVAQQMLIDSGSKKNIIGLKTFEVLKKRMLNSKNLLREVN
jgi:hypothetical protein